jgi:hypothetical protein
MTLKRPTLTADRTGRHIQILWRTDRLAHTNPSELAYDLKKVINLTKDHAISAKINFTAYVKRTMVKNPLLSETLPKGEHIFPLHHLLQLNSAIYGTALLLGRLLGVFALH